MKSAAWLCVPLCLVIVQACSPQQGTQTATGTGAPADTTATATGQQAAPDAATTGGAQNPAAAGGPQGDPAAQNPGAAPQGGAPGEPPPSSAQLKAMPKSQRLFEASKAALKRNDIKGCFEILDNAVVAAKSEHNVAAVILCRETQAKLRTAEHKNKEAIEILESTLKEYDKPGLDENTSMRMDMPKGLLANLKAVVDGPAAAEPMYLKGLETAKKQKPVNHARVAFWLNNLAEFYQFKKDAKKANEYSKQFKAEMDQVQAPQGGMPPQAAQKPANAPH